MLKIYILPAVAPQDEFLDVIGTKVFKSFPHCYSQSPVQLDFTPLSPPEWFETGLLCKNRMRESQDSTSRTLKIMPGKLNKIVRS